LLGYVLGPLVEENFRRALLLSRGDLLIFVERPISATFIAVCALLIVIQLLLAIRPLFGRDRRKRLPTRVAADIVAED
jgi:putative tricarboxylic transport membrane protein